VDARSDIYSLACVLYEMLAGEPPYTGPTSQAILARKLLDAMPSLRVVRDTVPPPVEAAIRRALARVPADRQATAHEFAAALSGSADAAAVPGHRPGLARGRLVTAASVIVVVAAAGYVALALTGGRPPGPPVAGSHTRLTVDPGVEWFPSLSPDAQWVVYAGEAAGNRDIYLLSVGGQKPINLTADSPADDDQPAFSPDGERLAFRSEREGGGLFVMGRTGEAVRRVTRFGYRPTWSPDGSELAFVTENVELNPQNSDIRGQLWIAEVGTGATRQIEGVDAALPSWSPHGQRIAFYQRLGQPAQGDVWTVAVADGEQTPVTTGPGRDWSPVWSPDGRYLYFVSDRGGSMNLWRVRIDEASGRPLADPEPVTTPATSLAHASVAADGRHIVYSSVLVTSNVQRVGFDPGRGTVVGAPEWVTQGSRRWANPEPSPDGHRLVFYSLVEPEGQLHVAPTDGSARPRRMTADSASDRVPRWSPDGEWIAMFSNRSGPLQIWKIHPDGSGLAQLTDLDVNVAFPVWSPDGTRMAAASTARPETFVFDPRRAWTEQRPETLPAPPDSLAPFAPNSWSADGRYLAGMVSALDRGIIVYTFATRAYRRLTQFGQWPVWLPDNRRVLFVSGGNAFYLADRVTGEVGRVFAVSPDVIGPPQLTRDGRTMYYTRRVTEADIWMVTLQ
jgi:Tol biopolymer transport system component